jgi:hypothetical protein
MKDVYLRHNIFRPLMGHHQVLIHLKCSTYPNMDAYYKVVLRFHIALVIRTSKLKLIDEKYYCKLLKSNLR